MSLISYAPDAAWSWAAEIQNESTRVQALQSVYGQYSTLNRAAADELLNSATLPEAVRKQVEQARINKRNAEMEIQRMTDMIAKRAADSSLTRMPPVAAKPSS